MLSIPLERKFGALRMQFMRLWRQATSNGMMQGFDSMRRLNWRFLPLINFQMDALPTEL